MKIWGKVESREKGESQEQKIRKGSEYLLIEIFTCSPAIFSLFYIIDTKITCSFDEHAEIVANYTFTSNINT